MPDDNDVFLFHPPAKEPSVSGYYIRCRAIEYAIASSGPDGAFDGPALIDRATNIFAFLVLDLTQREVDA